jgi:hypothetical protein
MHQRSSPVLAKLGESSSLRLSIQLAQVRTLPCLDREISKPSKKRLIPAPTAHTRQAVYRDLGTGSGPAR